MPSHPVAAIRRPLGPAPALSAAAVLVLFAVTAPAQVQLARGVMGSGAGGGGGTWSLRGTVGQVCIGRAGGAPQQGHEVGFWHDYICQLTDVPASEARAPLVFALRPNRPNPFNPSTTIVYELPLPGPVSLRVFDATGRQVRVLRRAEFEPAGVHRVVWEGMDERGRPVASGVYLCLLESEGRRQAGRMLLLK